MKALVCVDGRDWETVVRGAARYLPPGAPWEPVLAHVVDERVSRGHELALRGLLGRSRPRYGEDPLEPVSRAAAEALLSDAAALLGQFRPDLKVESMLLVGPPNEELARAATSAGVVFVGRGTPGGPPRREPHKQETVSGTLVGWRTNPHGEPDGFLLDDGTEVRFPPHRAGSVREIFRDGARVEATGERRGRRGEHLHARILRDPASGASVAAHEAPGGGPGKRPLGPTARYLVDHVAGDVVVVAQPTIGP